MCALWSKSDPDAERRLRLLMGVLEDIRDQRAKLKLEFPAEVTALTDLSASLLDFDPDGLTVEVSSLGGAGHGFDGAPVRCYFRVRERSSRGPEQYLSFDSAVREMTQRPSGMVHFRLGFPENLRSAQLRRSVRVQVDERKVPSLTLWPEFSGHRDLNRLAPVLGPEHLKARLFKVDNFSANGMRLIVQPARLRELDPQPQRGMRYAACFSAVLESGAPAQSFWVLAEVRDVFHDPQAAVTEIGFEFTAEGQRDEKLGLEWKPLRFDEVTGLGKFVFKWNLNLYREKGVGF